MKNNNKFTPEDDKKITAWLEELKPTFSKGKKMDWKGASLIMFSGSKTPTEICHRYNTYLKYKGVQIRHGKFTKREKVAIAKRGPKITLVGRTSRQISRFYLALRKRAAVHFNVALADVTSAQLLELIN